MPGKLTFQTAIKEFPIGSMNVLFKPLEFTASELAWAALHWLAGRSKPLKHLGVDWNNPLPAQRLCGDTEKVWVYQGNACIPHDPLRWLLEEVREQLEREREEADDAG